MTEINRNAWLARARTSRAEIAALKQRVADYEASDADNKELIRQLDIAICGDDAALQASLCDLAAILPKMFAALRAENERLREVARQAKRLADAFPMDPETSELDVALAALTPIETEKR